MYCCTLSKHHRGFGGHMRHVITITAVLLAGCAGMQPLSQQQLQQLMQATQTLQQARPQPAPQQPSMFPQQQRCVTSQVGGQWVTTCN